MDNLIFVDGVGDGCSTFSFLFVDEILLSSHQALFYLMSMDAIYIFKECIFFSKVIGGCNYF